MVWLILFVLLPIAIIAGGVLFFNLYLRKQIIRDSTPKPAMDLAYMEAEQTRGDDEDFGSGFSGKVD